MRREAVPIPTIPQVLQRRAEPMQQPVPGGQSFKQRRRQKKEDQRLKEQYGEHADHVSAAIKQQLDELTVEREVEQARMTSLRDEADRRNVKVEVKVLNTFITGYKTGCSACTGAAAAASSPAFRVVVVVCICSPVFVLFNVLFVSHIASPVLSYLARR